jgi:monoamine oxidase
MYNAVIVGGGIAGLHTGIRIAKHGLSCCILDEYSCGGRVQTYHLNDSVHWENGAGRISTDHHLVLSYLKKYGLTLIPLPTEIDYLSKKGLTDNPFYTLQKTLLSVLQSVPMQILATKTVKEILKEVMPLETDFYKAFPYYAEMSVLRADIALQSFQHELGTHKGFVICKEGLSTMIDNMKEEFISLGGTIVEHMHVRGVETVNQFTFLHAIDKKTKEQCTYHAPICVLAVPRDSLSYLLRIPSVTSVLQHLKMVPLLRIYMVFKTPWFSDLHSTVVDGPIRYIIPISDTTIMISYTEGPFATYWMKKDRKEVCSLVLNEIRRLFPDRTIPHPEVFKMHRWSQGCTYWLPGHYSVEEQSLKIMHPKRGIFVCGESYAVKQCWMESALEHAELLWSHQAFIELIDHMVLVRQIQKTQHH